MKQLLTLILSLAMVFAQDYQGSKILLNKKNPQVMTLGTFHFSFQQNDAHKTKEEKLLDILTPERQAELTELVEKLKAFKPTKIMVEWRDPVKTNKLYQEWRKGQHRDKRNEVYQLAFHLADELGYDTIYTGDALGRNYTDLSDNYDELEKQYIVWKEKNADELKAKNWGARYSEYYEKNDSYKLEHSLLAVFKRMNNPVFIKEMHGTYLTGSFDFEVSDFSFTGVDGFVSSWYNRNLRIFRNIKRVIENENDRILFIIGAGHLPILNHAIDYSPDMDYYSPLKVLGK